MKMNIVGKLVPYTFQRSMSQMKTKDKSGLLVCSQKNVAFMHYRCLFKFCNLKKLLGA